MRGDGTAKARWQAIKDQIPRELTLQGHLWGEDEDMETSSYAITERRRKEDHDATDRRAMQSNLAANRRCALDAAVRLAGHGAKLDDVEATATAFELWLNR